MTRRKAKEPEPLIPPDLERCQAEKPNGNTFMTLGGVTGLVRCEDRPAVVITAVAPGPDGRVGSMALCGPCLAVAYKQLGVGAFTVEPIGSQS